MRSRRVDMPVILLAGAAILIARSAPFARTPWCFPVVREVGPFHLSQKSDS
jgi:hypothetical protein